MTKLSPVVYRIEARACRAAVRDRWKEPAEVPAGRRRGMGENCQQDSLTRFDTHTFFLYTVRSLLPLGLCSSKTGRAIPSSCVSSPFLCETVGPYVWRTACVWWRRLRACSVCKSQKGTRCVWTRHFEILWCRSWYVVVFLLLCLYSLEQIITARLARLTPTQQLILKVRCASCRYLAAAQMLCVSLW